MQVRRRSFFRALAAPPMMAAAQQSSTRSTSEVSLEGPLWYTPATVLAAAIRERRLSPVELAETILARIEKFNPLLNAFCTLAEDQAMDAARKAEAAVMRGGRLGALHGVPVSIKDIVFTKGIRTTGGSRIYRDYVPDEDEVVVERLKAAGAIILGKTNVPEFGYKGVTSNRLFGETVSPWNLERTPGGSSGGAGAAGSRARWRGLDPNPGKFLWALRAQTFVRPCPALSKLPQERPARLQRVGIT